MKICHSLPIDPIDKQGVLPPARYFPFLQEIDTVLNCTKNYIAKRTIGGTTFVEIKSNSESDWNFSIRHKGNKFWMVFQLLGESLLAIDPQSKIEHQQYLAFYSAGNSLKLNVQRGKAALLLIGLKIKDIEPFAMEWRSFQLDQHVKFKPYPIINIGYRVKNILNHIQRTKHTYFSLRHRLSLFVIQLIDTYYADLVERSKSTKQADVSLFHRAKDYIVAHYMDEEISIKQMVSELRTSRRTLFRVFKENGLSINSAIQSIRIYKGREMLRRTDLSVDMIAFHLQFSTAKYFIKQYVKYFGHTPAKERKLKEIHELAKISKKRPGKR